MLIDNNTLNALIQEAQHSPRLRKNLNLHESLADSVQRMFNAIEPGSIIPIARHSRANETIVIVKGSLKVTTYDNDKNIIEEVILNHNDGIYCFHIPQGTWHKSESLESGTVIFETKEGPYEPLRQEDIFPL